MKTNELINIICLSLLISSITGCSHSLPMERFVFDSKFDSLYKAVCSKDSIFFENSKNNIDTFILTKTDSTFFNRVNCFMCGPPGKSIFRFYKQYPINYWADSVFENQGAHLGRKTGREVQLIGISKFADKDTVDKDFNTAYLCFKNFHCSLERSLGKPSNDTLRISNHLFTNYYIFKSTAPTLVVNDTDVKTVYVSLIDGIIAYKEKSGVIRKRIW